MKPRGNIWMFEVKTYNTFTVMCHTIHVNTMEVVLEKSGYWGIDS